MERLDKIKIALEKGFTYDSITGKIYNIKGREIKCFNSRGYIVINISSNKKRFHLYGHQFAWYYVYNEIVDCIDHIDRDKSNNSISNLRSITQKYNTYNSSCKGYTYSNRDNTYYSSIHVNNKRIHLGSFNNETDARKAYLDAKEIYHIIPTK